MKKFHLFVVLILVGCPKPIPKPDPQIPTDTANCADACKHIGPEGLNCPEGKTLDDGTTCTKFCEDTQNTGHSLHASCVMKIQKCSDMETIQHSNECPFK